MASVPVGTEVTKTAYRAGTKPKWMRWTGASTLKGTAVLPSGHRRLVYAASNFNNHTDEDIYVQPVVLPTTEARWRMAIYSPNGAYVTATGLGDLPTIGTPQVRLGVNAPSKATVKVPATRGPGNILASSFAEWSDGHSEAIARGMEVTIEFRDEKSGTMRLVFRGMIYQIESGEQITITAYDRLMDLAQYSDQYQGSGELNQNDTSRSRETSGTNYVYTMNNRIGTLLSATSVDLLRIDALGDMGHADPTVNKNGPKFIVHPLPSVDGMTPEQGRRITRVQSKFYVGIYGRWGGAFDSGTGTVTLAAHIVLFRRINNSMQEVARTEEYKIQTSKSSSGVDPVTNYAEGIFTTSVDWMLEGSASEYYIGVIVEQTTAVNNWYIMLSNAYAEYSGTRRTVTGDYYTSPDGNTWTQVSSGDLPEVSIDFEHTGGAIATSAITVSGTNATVAISNLPIPTFQSSYISVVGYPGSEDNLGIQLMITYFVAGSIGISSIIQKMIENAGLECPFGIDSVGQTDYYATTTYDYLTCIIELIRTKDMGIKALADQPGAVVVKPIHTTAEAPVLSFTTNPAGAGEQAILKHQLTAHWMAEKATQAYIAENATASGLPIALETDDELMDNSLVQGLQSPLRSVIADATLGTHDLMANAAGGKMRQLHTNVFEGTMVLAGYRLDVWDFSSGQVGGQPIGIEVPEYGANGTAVPTEIIIGDGATQVSLDNIRTADRSELANSMGLSADANSNSADAVPDTVFIFAKIDDQRAQDTGYNRPDIYGVSEVILITDGGGTAYAQNDTNYIKAKISDDAGYYHVAAVFPSSLKPTGFAPTNPIINVSLKMGNNQYWTATVTNPKNAYAGQHVHVDIRFKKQTQ